MADIELYSKLNEPLEAIDRIGTMFAKSGMFGCDKKEQGDVLAFACMVEKKSPIQILREYHLIDGRLCDRADSMLAKFRGRGGKYRIVARTSEESSIELVFDQQKMIFSVTWKEMQAEPFVMRNDGKGYKRNWATPRARMQTMWARVVSDGIRALCPEIVAGVVTPEEAQDEPIGIVEQPRALFTEKAKASKTVQMEVVKPEPKVEEPAKEEQPPPAEPTQVTAEPAQPQARIAKATPKGTLTPETVAMLEEVIGAEHAEAALRWLEQKKWIEPMGNLSQLSVKRAQLILNEPEKLTEKLKEGGLL